MSKKSFLSKFTEKMLRKEKVSSAFESGWNTHAAMFGPIMENAFVENDGARVRLVAILNYISRCEVSKALKKLQHLRKYCETENDEVAWLFFFGLAMERGQCQKEAVELWTETAQYHPKYYLLYLKLAKYAHSDADYETAEEYYREAIQCLLENPVSPKEQNGLFLASAYCNFATCLTMMHRYQEADKMLRESEKWKADFPERIPIKEMLKEKVENP